MNIVKNNYFKKQTVCRNCYNKNTTKNKGLIQNEIITSNQQLKIENVNNNKGNVSTHSVSTYENQAYVVIGPRNVRKTCYMLKILEKTGNKRRIHKITRSPNQYPNFKISNEIKPIDLCRGSVIMFDDMCGARNSSQVDKFFTIGRHENLDVYYISHSHFGLPRQSIRNDSDRLILFKQTPGDVESMYRDIRGYGMKYDECKKMCRKAWSEQYNYLCIDLTKYKNDGKYRVFNESKNT